MAELRVTDDNVGFNRFRVTDLNSTLQTVNPKIGNVYSYNVINPNSADAYIKFFDVAGTTIDWIVKLTFVKV